MPVDQTEARPDWLDAQLELIRLQKLMAELEAGRRRGRSTLPLRLVRDRLERHVERWASTWAKEAAALMAQFEDVSSHLCIAAARLEETDSDQVTLEHIHEGLKSLGERKKYMITIAELYESLERDYIINGRKSRRNITSVWKNHLRAVFGQLPAAGVSSDKIAEYIVARQKQGAKNATINRETSCLQRLYTLAVQAGKLTRSPHIFHLAERNVRQGFLRDSQVDALARETARVGLWLYGIFLVAFTYGWRKTELLRLRVRQCDFIERSITLDAGTTKNDEARQVRMTDEVFDLLLQCVAGKDQEAFVFTRTHESNGRKTKTRDGKVADLRDDWAKACLAAGCHGLLLHDLRRTAARNLIRAGVPQKTSQAITGHRTPSVFARYQIIDESDLQDAVRKLESSATRRREEGRFDPEPVEHRSGLVS